MNRMLRVALVHERRSTSKRVNLRDVLADNATMLQLSKAVVVHVEPGNESVFVRGDRLAIERAILNLVSNAIYWTEAKMKGERRVDVQLSKDGGSAIVEVSDTGVGIGPEIRDRVLDKFVTGRPDSGTGLGLATVAETMQAHRGQVTYHDNPRGGATFCLIFPLEETR
jgi:signal transduction histidine kinase